MMRYIEGEHREQSTLFPESLEEYITEDNPVRFIDAYIEQLDFHALEFVRATPKDTGRPGYHPATLLKLYVYGYLNRIQSSRRLERETHRNVELMWLLSRLRPDFKTIADFRRDNGSALKQVCREFVVLCRRLDLFDLEIVAVDGSKFKGVNNKDRNFTPTRVAVQLKIIEEDISRYLTALDASDLDEQSAAKITAAGLQTKLEHLKQEKSRYKALQRQLEETGLAQVSLTDPDTRAMATRKGGSKVVGYNVQTAVEPKHHFIVAHEVTNAVTDKRQLYNIASQARDALEVEELEVLADSGYYTGAEVLGCLEEGMTPYVPRTYTSISKRQGRYGKQDFLYEHKKDRYRCPAGKHLTYAFTTVEQGREICYYTTNACKGCALKEQCTTAKQRRLTRWVHEEIMDDMEAALMKDPGKMKLRKQTVEHPYGTIKSWMGSTHFLMKRLPNVQAEMSLHVLAYNIKRALSVMGITKMMEAIA